MTRSLSTSSLEPEVESRLRWTGEVPTTTSVSYLISFPSRSRWETVMRFLRKEKGSKRFVDTYTQRARTVYTESQYRSGTPPEPRPRGGMQRSPSSTVFFSSCVK